MRLVASRERRQGGSAAWSQPQPCLRSVAEPLAVLQLSGAAVGGQDMEGKQREKAERPQLFFKCFFSWLFWTTRCRF